jgi:hypothetical protein
MRAEIRLILTPEEMTANDDDGQFWRKGGVVELKGKIGGEWALGERAAPDRQLLCVGDDAQGDQGENTEGR